MCLACVVIVNYRFAVILFRDKVMIHTRKYNGTLSHEPGVRRGHVSRYYLLITLTVLPRSRTLTAADCIIIHMPLRETRTKRELLPR